MPSDCSARPIAKAGVSIFLLYALGVSPLIVLSTLHVPKTAPQSPQFSSRSIYYLSYQGCLLTSIYCAAHSFTVFPPQCQRIGYTEPGISVHIRKSNSVLDGTQIESVDLVFFGFALGSQPFQNGLTIDAVWDVNSIFLSKNPILWHLQSDWLTHCK